MVKTERDGPVVLRADGDMVPQLCGLIRRTVRETYAKYYPEEAVRYFPDLYGDEAVRKDVSDGKTYAVEVGGKIAAAGARGGDRIRYYEQKGVLCVEMEGAGLFAAARFRSRRAAGIYVVSDAGSGDEWDPGWGEKALETSIERVIGAIAGTD